MNKKLKDLLLKCQVHLEEEDFDNLIKTLEDINSVNLKDLSKEEYEEAIRILNFLIDKAEEKRTEIAQKLVNFQRFKGGYIR